MERGRRNVVAWLVEPAPLPIAFAAAAIVALITWTSLVPQTRGSGVFRVDEAHKVSETVALRLLLERRWNDPIWFGNLVDRTNPPFGKYVFGTAVLLSGQPLPRTPSLSRLAGPDAVMPMFAPPEDGAPYVPLLEPCRRAALLATALGAAAIAWVTSRLYGMLAGCIPPALFVSHWTTSQFGTSALFDPVLVGAVALTAVALLLVIESRRSLAAAVLAGLLCAAAFQTRLNGGVALLAVLAGLAVVFARERSSKRAIAALVVCAVFASTAIAMNPYYWASTPDDGGVRAVVRDTGAVARVPLRFAQQVGELRTILTGLTRGGVRLPLWAAESPARKPVAWTLGTKLRFIAIAIFDRWTSLLLLALAVAGSVAIVRERRTASLALLAWSAVVVLITVAWLPLPWARYLLPILPALGIPAAAAIAAVLKVLPNVPRRAAATSQLP